MNGLSHSETAALFVEGIDKKMVKKAKEEWKITLSRVKKDFKFKGAIDIEYYPLIWHFTKYPVGIRIYRSIGGFLTVIEFSTPNKMIPFDIFSDLKAKRAVLAHEISHIFDDQRWYSDQKKLICESRDYVSREQRAELLAFLYDPLGIIYSNISLIEVALFLSHTKLKRRYIDAYAILETLGRIGMNRNIEIPLFFEEMGINQNIDVAKLLRHHITYPFSLSGLVVSPGGESRGIARTIDLISCREMIISYIEGKLKLRDLNRKLRKLGYCTTTKNHLSSDVKKIVIPEILDPSSLDRIKEAESFVSKLEFTQIKEDMLDALRMSKNILKSIAN